MSRGINKVILIGHLGTDPEVRALPSGDTVANGSLATRETWRDKSSGEARERTEWHRIVLFGRLAEIAGQSLRSGSKVYLEGKLRTRQYRTEDGAERSVTEVVVDRSGTLQMLDGRPGGTDASPRTGKAGPHPRGPGQRPTSRTPPSRGRSTRPERTPVPDFDDDIPF